MIRGVNRYTVEVNRTGSPYFERAICFVRPEFTQCDRLDLHKAAQQLVRALDGCVEVEENAGGASCESDGKTRYVPRQWILAAVAGVGGALISFIVSYLLMR